MNSPFYLFDSFVQLLVKDCLLPKFNAFYLQFQRCFRCSTKIRLGGGESGFSFIYRD